MDKVKMKENRRKQREKKLATVATAAAVEGAAPGGAPGERKARRGKVMRKRGKRTVVDKVWARCRGEWPAAPAREEVLARRPWVESKAVKSTGKRKTVVRGVSPRRSDHRRGRWRRKEARKRSAKGGRGLDAARRVERVAAAQAAGGGGDGNSGVKAQRDQRHKLAKQT